MERINGNFKRTVAGREVARQRLRQMCPRGTDKEYNIVLQEEYQALHDFRRAGFNRYYPRDDLVILSKVPYRL